MTNLLEIKDLSANVEGKSIIKELNLKVGRGEIHAIMGPNGAGKSTFAKILAGHKSYEITSGTIFFKGADLIAMQPEERAHAGLFMGFQYPVEIPGVSNVEFLKAAYNCKRKANGASAILDAEFDQLMDQKMEEMGIKKELKGRNVNEGFSGGEKKRNEILQMAVLDPILGVLDETDSGLDIDALRIVANGVNRLMKKDKGLIIITHYQRLLDYIKPDFVHVMIDGSIVQSGGKDLALELESRGYDWITSK